jgi:hypothetical protein
MDVKSRTWLAQLVSKRADEGELLEAADRRGPRRQSSRREAHISEARHGNLSRASYSLVGECGSWVVARTSALISAVAEGRR